MNKLILATLLLLIAFIVLAPDDTSVPVGFYGGTGFVKQISGSDAKKLLKFGKLIKLDNDNWVKKCSIGF